MAEKTAQKKIARPPVIVVMGHIDHGKSTLLDYIRKSNVTEREAGGITQHVSAYEVLHETPAGKKIKITFLDTPGHAAFSSIRERGVRIADIAILIVSADDGVKPQTVEALEAIKSAGLPYLVAINKIDKPSANIEKTKASLAESGIFIEGYGGDVPAVSISAKAGTGVGELLDMIELMTELQEFTADPEAPAAGYVLESNLDPKKGITATLIIKDGTISRGQFVAAAGAVAPVRIMEDFLGKPATTVTFSSPVRIIGWDNLPQVGAEFRTFGSKNDAAAFAATHAVKEAVQKLPATETEGEIRASIPVIVKADTVGSLEAIEKELGKLSNEKIDVKIVQSGIGAVSENDLRSAEAAKDAVVLCFNTKPDPAAKSYALRNGIEVHEFDIIYKLTEWFETIVAERTPKVLTKVPTGEAKILKTFSKNRDKQVVGGSILSGSLKSGQRVDIVRRDSEIGEGLVRELQHNKSKVSEVKEGMEFGTLIEVSTDLAPGDRIVAFEMIEQ